MTTATATKNARQLVAAATNNSASGTTRGTLDLRTAFGGQLTMKVTNGATGPTVGCSINVLIAHNGGATPTAASAGTDWKTHQTFTHITTANAIGEFSIPISKDIMHLEVEFTGNTGQAVTVEAFLSETSSINNA